jgi:spermidine synthase
MGRSNLGNSIAPSHAVIKKPAFLTGVSLITFSVLVLQIVQTRILSVIAWYYLAFFAISVAMLGMTIGAVWVYLRRDRFLPDRLASDLSWYALATAVSIPASMMVQFSLITTLSLTASTIVSWALLLAAMAVPYAFAGVVVSLALTRSPFPVSQVYSVDLLGAALGCAAVVLLLNVLDGPTTLIVIGLTAAFAAYCFTASTSGVEQQQLKARAWWQRPVPVMMVLLALSLINALTPLRLRPMLVKDKLERSGLNRFEQWNSYSRVIATRPSTGRPMLWGRSPRMPKDLVTQEVFLNIDGDASTDMFHYDGTRESIEFLRYDLVNLAYNLPGIRKAAIIGVGGGRDLLSAHLYGVPEIIGVELNPIFIDLHTKHPYYKVYSNVTALPNLKLYVDDARSWFASTDQKFDLVQMSMIDTWAATGAGAFSLSENGLYTLEGWRAFIKTLNDKGIFTVSRWYNPSDVDETGRMIGLATAALLDAGVSDARPYLVVAHAKNIATLVLSKSPFTHEQLKILNGEIQRLGFEVLLAPGQSPKSPLLASMIASKDIDSLNKLASSSLLDITVSTDNRPFFFNQLRFSRIPQVLRHIAGGGTFGGVFAGNLQASIILILILWISISAVIITIILPLRSAAKNCPRPLIAAGSAYFSLIGMGFMFAEISLLQYFSVYLGHPIYSLGVCLFSLILATGLGSLASNRLNIASSRGMLVWGLIVVAYLLCLQQWLTDVFHATTARDLSLRISISLAVVIPLGFLLGFAFPTGMKLVEAVDKEPTPWFWGINGATSVLASVLAVMLSMSMGIRVTMLLSSVCYAVLIPVGFRLMRLRAVSAGSPT